MDRRFVGIALILGGLSMMILIVYFVFFHDYGGKAVVDGDDKQTSTTTTALEPIKNNLAAESTSSPADEMDPLVAIKNNATASQKIAPSGDEMEKIKVSNLGKAFSERYGSFSNQSDFGNITDLEMFMSSKMRAWAQAEVVKLRTQNRGGEKYYGITTKVVGHDFVRFDNSQGEAEMSLQTRRRETNDKDVNSYNQNMVIKFVKEGGNWLVDSADWDNGKE